MEREEGRAERLNWTEEEVVHLLMANPTVVLELTPKNCSKLGQDCKFFISLQYVTGWRQLWKEHNLGQSGLLQLRRS